MIGIVPEAVETTQRVKAETALPQSMKIEAIGQLTGGLAHDFNNPLNAIVGNLDLIRRRSMQQNVRKWAVSGCHRPWSPHRGRSSKSGRLI